MSVAQKPRPQHVEPADVLRDRPSAKLEHGVLANVAAHLRAGSLDRALAAGADPGASRQLAARARLLTSRRRRAAAACALERLVRSAQGPHRRWWALSHHNTVLANSSELHALASLLRSERPVYAHGVALLNQLLSNGTGPVYQDGGDELAPLLQRVHAAIEGRAGR
jgi:hypothetical protein